MDSQNNTRKSEQRMEETIDHVFYSSMYTSKLWCVFNNSVIAVGFYLYWYLFLLPCIYICVCVWRRACCVLRYNGLFFFLVCLPSFIVPIRFRSAPASRFLVTPPIPGYSGPCVTTTNVCCVTIIAAEWYRHGSPHRGARRPVPSQ